MSEEPVFNVRYGAKLAKRWRNTRSYAGMEDRPDFEEVCLFSWNEDHGVGQSRREVVVDYAEIPHLIVALTAVMAQDRLGRKAQFDAEQEDLEDYRAAVTKHTTAATRADIEADRINRQIAREINDS